MHSPFSAGCSVSIHLLQSQFCGTVPVAVTDHICCCSRVQSNHLCGFVERESVRLNEVVQPCSDKAAEKAKHWSWDLLSSVNQWCYCPRRVCVSNLPGACMVQDIPGVTHHLHPLSCWAWEETISLVALHLQIASSLPPENISWDLGENFTSSLLLEVKGIKIAFVNKSNYKGFSHLFLVWSPSRSEVKYTAGTVHTSVACVSLIISCDQWWKHLAGAFTIL